MELQSRNLKQNTSHIIIVFVIVLIRAYVVCMGHMLSVYVHVFPWTLKN